MDRRPLATIEHVAKADPITIWKIYRKDTAVDRASFDTYFEGAQQAVAIILVEARHVGPITIEQLREIRDSFHPPQVLMRLTESEAKALQKLAEK
jgi:predicted transcriptional regulator